MATTESIGPVLSSKDPDETKRYGVNVKHLLESVPSATTLTGVEVNASDPSGLAFSNVSMSGTYALATTTGGVAGLDYAVTFHLTFSDNQTRDRTIIIPCRPR